MLRLNTTVARTTRDIPSDHPVYGLDAVNKDPANWLKQIRKPLGDRSPWLFVGCIPSEPVRSYLFHARGLLTHDDLRFVMRALLPGGVGPVGSDMRNFEEISTRSSGSAGGGSNEYERRLLGAALAPRLTRPSPIPDLTWLIDLALVRPSMVQSVVTAYRLVHAQYLNDLVLDGLSDFAEIVRRHLVEVPTTYTVDAIRELSTEDFSRLVAGLWVEQGWLISDAAKVSSLRTRQISRKSSPKARTLLVAIPTSRKAGVSLLRECLGEMAHQSCSDVVVVSSIGFTSGPRGAESFAKTRSEMSIIDGGRLAELVVANYGPESPRNVQDAIWAARFAEKLPDFIDLLHRLNLMPNVDLGGLD